MLVGILDCYYVLWYLIVGEWCIYLEVVYFVIVGDYCGIVVDFGVNVW